MAASIAPDVEDPAFYAQRPSATVTNYHGLVLIANPAGPTFNGFDHESLTHISCGHSRYTTFLPFLLVE